MGAFAPGVVVILPFPFSDLTGTKYRPALLIADIGQDDWIACQITSRPYADSGAIALSESDFISGSLNKASYVRPGKLFTANVSLSSRVAPEKFPNDG